MTNERAWDVEILRAAREAVDEIEWLDIAQKIRLKALALGVDFDADDQAFSPPPSPLTPSFRVSR